MCNQTIDLSPLVTRPGFLRICFHTITLVALGLTGAALDKSLWGRAGNHCPQTSCPALKLVEWSLAFVILSWLFGLLMMLTMVLPKYNRTTIFYFANNFGYPTFGFLLTGSFILIVAYLLQVMLFVPCNFFSKGCEFIKDDKWTFFQPGYLGCGAIIALVAGILGIYITKDKKGHGTSNISSTQTYSNQTTSRPNSIVSA